MDVSFYLKRASDKNETVIFARIFYGYGEPAKWYLPEKINPAFWNKNEQRAKETKKFPEYPEFNNRLDKIQGEIKSVIRRYIDANSNELPSPGKVRELLDQELKNKGAKVAHDFISYFQEIIDKSKSGERKNPKNKKRISPATIKHYETAIGRIRAYRDNKSARLRFDDVDLSFYKSFTTFLTDKLGLADNTVGKQIKTVKFVMEQAVTNGLTSNLAYKHEQFMSFSEDADTIFIPFNELEEIAALDFSGNDRLDRARDLFLVGCYTGLRFSDFSTLKPSHFQDGYITITQTKTAKTVVIPVHGVIEQLMAKYGGNLPDPISNQKLNEYIKDVVKELDCFKRKEAITRSIKGEKTTENRERWQLVSTHTARRSFATNEYLAGTPTLTIMSITGHKTEKAFLRYIRVTPKQHAEHMKKMWVERKLSK